MIYRRAVAWDDAGNGEYLEFRGGVLVDDSANYRVLVWFSFSLSGRRWAEKAWAKFKMNVPLFKGLFLRLYNARFARTAQMLLSAGVPMLEAMGIAGEAVNNILCSRIRLCRRRRW